MENKIIMVNLDTDMPEGFAVQYDYGQTLRIQGGTLPKAVEVLFRWMKLAVNQSPELGQPRIV